MVFTALAAVPLLIATLVFSAVASGAAAGPASSAGSQLPAVTVSAGDTLWSIAVAASPAADPRDVILEIMQLNGLDTVTIEPGARLALPAGSTGE